MTLSNAQLRELVQHGGFPCVSLYLPTHPVPADREQDRIRLKNLIQQAEEGLVDGGLRTPAAKDLLAPARKLYDSNPFWGKQGDGLAVFLAAEFARHYRLPLAFKELVVVAERFHIKPLLPLLNGDGRYYILAISQKSVKLLQGTRHSVAEVDLAGVPQSLAEALKYDQFEKELQFHTRAAERGGERAAMFHGHGQAHGEDPKNQLLRYFQQIDRGLQEFLASESTPLIVAGVDYYLPIFRDASHYPHLVDEVISGNPDSMRAEELQQRAWAILEPRFRRERDKAAALYRQFAGTGRTSAELQEILPATHQGRVQFLFVPGGQQRWGTFDPTKNEVTSHERAEPGDQDLFDLSAAQAFANGATVYVVEPADLPNGSSLAAVFRY